MSSEQSAATDKRYYSVIDGTFRAQVPSDHPEAVAREWKTNDGKSGVKYERIVQALFGFVEGVEFHDGDYGMNLNITLDKDESGKNPVMSLSTSTPYGESMLKVLPNIFPGTEYRFRPYSFKDEKTDKDIRGVEVTMRGEDDKFTLKVTNFFYDAEKKEPLNGYPSPDGDTSQYKSDDWKLFYLQARKFLVKYTEENVLPRFPQNVVSHVKPAYDYPEDTPKPEDIPF